MLLRIRVAEQKFISTNRKLKCVQNHFFPIQATALAGTPAEKAT
jgi:hypothetical protein